MDMNVVRYSTWSIYLFCHDYGSIVLEIDLDFFKSLSAL